jgi:hypothetical protein
VTPPSLSSPRAASAGVEAQREALDLPGKEAPMPWILLILAIAALALAWHSASTPALAAALLAALLLGLGAMLAWLARRSPRPRP